MSIKSDRWIRRMAAKGMIEPFADAPDPRSIAGGVGGPFIAERRPRLLRAVIIRNGIGSIPVEAGPPIAGDIPRVPVDSRDAANDRVDAPARSASDRAAIDVRPLAFDHTQITATLGTRQQRKSCGPHQRPLPFGCKTRIM